MDLIRTYLKQLLSLWQRWQRGEPLGHRFTKWRDVFASLREIRPWGPADRLSDETIAYWQEDIRQDAGAMRRIEAELWYRDKDRSRAATLQRISELVAKVGGEIIDRATIVEICYQAVLIDIPATEIERFSEREEVHLLVCDDIMFLRPQSSMDVWKGSFELQREAEVPDEEPSTAPPIAALLDGVPVQNHVLLDGRLAIDDPDELERMSTVASRHHGTAMASLILHGDRNIMQRALSRPLHVRPVLYAPINEGDEQPNQNRLLIDVIYRAIKRIREGDDEGEATAPEVFLVNLSLGDRGRPFTRVMSPWAKLLDYLAEHYGILFLVSAGNIKEPLPINQFKKWAEFEDANPEDREWAVLSALLEQKAFRTLLLSMPNEKGTKVPNEKGTVLG